VAIETDIVNPACTAITKGLVPGLLDGYSKLLAAESMTDESYHTTLVTEAMNITEENRGVSFKTGEFNFVKRLQEEQALYPTDPFKRLLVLMAMTVVSEIFISNYLSLLSESTTVQPINRMTVAAHRKDEMNHSKIFKTFAKAIYSALDAEHKRFFATALAKPIVWFADKDLELWHAYLKSIGFEGADAMIADCHKQAAVANLRDIDYSEIISLAKEIGIKDIEETLGLRPASCLAMG
jgi:hypothetical protein